MRTTIGRTGRPTHRRPLAPGRRRPPRWRSGPTRRSPRNTRRRNDPISPFAKIEAKCPRSPTKPAVHPAPGDEHPRWRAVGRIALVLGVLLVLAGGAWYGHYWWTTGRYLVSTDDAYVGAKNATLSAKVMGYVSEVAVDDNARVHEGDVIARIDDGDYQLAVEAARDNVATQQATVDRIGRADRRPAGRRGPGEGAARVRSGRRKARASSSSSGSRTSRRATTRAVRRSNRRRPAAIRAMPRCRRPKRRSKRRRPMSTC